MVLNYEEHRKSGAIKDLLPTEKKYYEKFLETTYKNNAEVSEYILLKFPRWSIICGYYAMHDVSKLILAKKFNLKLSPPFVHSATIAALKELIPRKEIIGLIEKAEEYEEIKTIHGALLRGKDEREKSQYYIDSNIPPESTMQKSSYFFDKIVKPYIKLVEELMKK